MIHFTDGRTMTFAEAAQLLRAEGKLGVRFFDRLTGWRCAWGVIVDATNSQWETENRARVGGSLVDREIIFGTNDSFAGTAEERAAHMADWLDQLYLDDPEAAEVVQFVGETVEVVAD